MIWLTAAFSGWAHYIADFEGSNETKTAYASGTVTLASVDWELTQALIGTFENDKKHGERALRIRRDGDTPGTAEMLSDIPAGIGWMSLYYARYGTDISQPELFVEVSTNDGASWQQTGSSITNFPSALTRWVSVVNLTDPARIRLRTGLGGANQRRINVDDITLSVPGEGVPLVTTSDTDEIGSSSARVGGAVLDQGGSDVTSRGLVWNTTGNPAKNDWVAPAGEGTGEFSTNLTGLIAGQSYYVRAFAQNSNGIAYGSTHVFVTDCFTNAPVLHAITNRHSGGFTASWSSVEGASGYLLDIASDQRFHGGGIATVFRETMGSVDTETAISDHYLEDGFDHHAAYNYGDGDANHPATIRSTSVSSGYYTDPAGHPASGLANVWFESAANQYGFCIGNINPRPHTDLRLSFGYRKEAATNNATISLDWSGDDGAIWHALPLTGLPVPDALAVWHLVEDLALPAEAAQTDNLRIRWIKEGTTAMRIDDVLLRGDGGAPTLHPRFTAIEVNGVSRRISRIADGTWWVRVRAVGAAHCLSKPSNTRNVNVDKGGTVVVFK